MIILVVALYLVCILLINTWCMIFTLAKKGGTWINRGDLKFFALCAFINCYIILGIGTLFKSINEKINKRKRNRRKRAAIDKKEGD